MITRILSFSILCLVLCLGRVASGAMVTIFLTSDDLGLGSSDINQAGNGSAVEDDRPGKLVTSATANVGSVLTIQTDNLAGSGTILHPLLATVMAHTYMDVKDNLPPGADIHAGVITLTRNSGETKNDGLGARAFGIDTRAGATFAKRYTNPAFVSPRNPNGYQMEGSKEISGGVGARDFAIWLLGQTGSGIPGNNPPHVDEEVIFDMNDVELNIRADSVRTLLTRIKAGSDNLFDLGIELTINLVGGTSISRSYGRILLAPDVFSSPGAGIIEIDFSAASLGLGPTDLIDSFVIGARDDTIDPEAGTDEHFRIHAFTADVTRVPEPTTLALLVLGVLALPRRRR